MLRLQYLTGAIAGFKFAPLRLPSSGCYNLRAVIYWVGFGDGARCISLRNPFSRELSEGTAKAFFAKVASAVPEPLLEGAQHGQIFRSGLHRF